MASSFDITNFVERLKTLTITKPDWKKQLKDLEDAWKENNAPLVKQASTKIRSSIRGQYRSVPEIVKNDLEELHKGDKKPSSGVQRGLNINEISANSGKLKTNIHDGESDRRGIPQDKGITSQMSGIVDSLQRLKKEVESGNFPSESTVKESETHAIISDIRNTLRERESQTKKKYDQHEIDLKQLMEIHTTLCISPKTRRRNQNSHEPHPTICTIATAIKATIKNQRKHIAWNDLQTTSDGDIEKELVSFRSELLDKWDEWCAQNGELCPQNHTTTSERNVTHDNNLLDIIKDITILVESQLGHMTNLANMVNTTKSTVGHLDELTRAIKIQHSEVCSITEMDTTNSNQADVSTKQTPVAMLVDIKSYIGDQQAEIKRIGASIREMQKQVESAEKDLKDQNNQEKLYERNAQLEKYKTLQNQHNSEMKTIWLLLQPDELKETLRSSESETCENTTLHKEICQHVNEIQDEMKTMYSQTQYEELIQNFDMYENSFRHMWNEISEGNKFDPKTGVDNLLKEIRRLVEESKSSDENIYPLASFDEVNHQLQQCKEDTKQLWIVLHQKSSPDDTYDSNIVDIDSDAMSRDNYERVTRMKKTFVNMKTNEADSQDKLKKAKDEHELQLTRAQASEELLRQGIKELREGLNRANEERKGLLNRIYKVAGAKMSEENIFRFSKIQTANMTDTNACELSDVYRPSKLGEKFSELYDFQWTDAFEQLTDAGKSEQEAIQQLYSLLEKCHAFCIKTDKYQTSVIQSSLTCSFHDIQSSQVFKDIQLPTVESQMMLDFRKRNIEESTKHLQNQFVEGNDKQGYVVTGNVKVYADLCVEICWLMHLHSPPLFLETNADKKMEGRFDTNVFRPYTILGNHIEFVVWPPLHENGPVLNKGVAQGLQ